MYETDLLQEDAIEESLSHHGIKGQKWHLRRFQNPDGTYTELGKERRRVGYEDPDKKKEDEDDKSKSNKSTEPVLSEQTKEELIGGKA
jgi:predicted RNA-binding protein Jag